MFLDEDDLTPTQSVDKKKAKTSKNPKKYIPGMLPGETKKNRSPKANRKSKSFKGKSVHFVYKRTKTADHQDLVHSDFCEYLPHYYCYHFYNYSHPRTVGYLTFNLKISSVIKLARTLAVAIFCLRWPTLSERASTITVFRHNGPWHATEVSLELANSAVILRRTLKMASRTFNDACHETCSLVDYLWSTFLMKFAGKFTLSESVIFPLIIRV